MFEEVVKKAPLLRTELEEARLQRQQVAEVDNHYLQENQEKEENDDHLPDASAEEQVVASEANQDRKGVESVNLLPVWFVVIQ